MATPTHNNNPKELVRRSYDQISYAYRSDSVSRDRGYFAWLEALSPLLQPGSAILDIGCGCGIPVAQELAQRFSVTGVDLSAVQIARARQLVPQATFLCADMATLGFPVGAFAAIVSFFAIIHLPVHEHRPLLERCFAWLQPGGYVLATVGHQAWTGYKDNWYGAPMYWSHADETTYRTWLQELGFDLLWTQFIPEGDGGHVLVCARRPAQQPAVRRRGGCAGDYAADPEAGTWGGEPEGHTEAHSAEQRRAADCLQPTLRCGFRQQLTPSVRRQWRSVFQKEVKANKPMEQ